MQPAELRNIECRSILEVKHSDELNEQILRMKPNLQPTCIKPSGPVPAAFGARGGAVIEALRYKPEGRRIDSRWYHWNFPST
jgi:hypothetical protein